MEHTHHHTTEHNRLMGAAKAHAHQLRTQAITHFWSAAARALRRALKVTTRLMHGRVRTAQTCRQGI